jgi:hypothetical protein
LPDRSTHELTAFGAACETLSYLPEESPPDLNSQILARDSEFSFTVVAQARLSETYFQSLVKAVIVMRILGNADGMDLREEIWGAAATRTQSR